MSSGTLWAVLVGAVWGLTNPFVKIGTARAKAKQQRSSGNSLLCHLTTPEFVVPQTLNLLGGVLFASLLATVDLKVVVPVANASCLIFNALVDALLGEKYQLSLLLPGIALVVTGISLCT